MEVSQIENILSANGIRPTANRILVIQALAGHEGAVTLGELEQEIGTIDKSGIFRTVMLLKEHHLVHVLEGSGEGVLYELCMSHDHETDDDTHVHFVCERCGKTTCLHQLPIPKVDLPAGYEMHTANYTVRGLCPHCINKL